MRTPSPAHLFAAAGIAAALACGRPKTTPALAAPRGEPTVAVAVASAASAAAAPASAPDAGPGPDPEPITCKTEDDCWVDAHNAPARRPKALRGKRPKACHGTEHTPTCREGVCAVTAWKC